MKKLFIILSLLLSLSMATVTDNLGNIYNTVQIGDQLWMAENLKTTHYNNGDEIPNVFPQNSNNNIGKYGDYNNDTNNSEIYGKLYNWYAVDDERGICPEGLHIPSDEDFMQLETFLGLSEEELFMDGHRGTNEGSKLAGQSELWDNGNLDNNDQFGVTGFNAIPSGELSYPFSNIDGYNHQGLLTSFWTSTVKENDSGLEVGAYYRKLSI